VTFSNGSAPRRKSAQDQAHPYTLALVNASHAKCGPNTKVSSASGSTKATMVMGVITAH